MAKNKKNKRGPIIMAGLFVLGLIVGALISVYVLRQDLKPSTTPSVYKEAPKVVPPPVVTPVVKYSGPVVVFVIDDMGQTMRGVDTLLSLPV
ncbi:MAG: hypothetical protein KAR06_10270, partial [Deltaproteobacteria bacterium]|nr:hypothetical protein [Deltaproteobacteria bacterium]